MSEELVIPEHLLIIDGREYRSGVPQLLWKVFEERKFRPEVILKRVNNTQIDYQIGWLWIERKSAEDFVASIMDDRLPNQLYKMSTGAKQTILLIEGNIEKAFLEHNLNLNYLTAIKSGIALKRSPEGEQGVITTLHTINKEESALALYFLWNSITKSQTLRFPELQPIKWSNADRAKLLIEQLPKIGPAKRDSLISIFPTFRDLVNASTDEMQQAEGIGQTIAKNLYTIFNENLQE